ncbi:hypothetical protein Q8A67_010441 [Cirrhinus molitorella]|uniref:Uncharacterized protein n=1 Tax=Cirrhinus molitorella TaxID=172907 RepID=A0AA88PTQ7_9TELE|nr:hypothetical protein Q8A67_010441 [Cirrhinus molitorella]
MRRVLLRIHAAEELLEVVTRAVFQLKIDWPAEKHHEPQKNKQDECFLRTKAPPPRQSLLFFPNLHTEVSRLVLPSRERLDFLSCTHGGQRCSWANVALAKLQQERREDASVLRLRQKER